SFISPPYALPRHPHSFPTRRSSDLFLVTGDGWRDAAHKVVPMAQGYLNDAGSVEAGAMKASVRVRIEGGAAFLNIKSREAGPRRSEEHTSELQSRENLVCRLLLEKK